MYTFGWLYRFKKINAFRFFNKFNSLFIYSFQFLALKNEYSVSFRLILLLLILSQLNIYLVIKLIIVIIIDLFINNVFVEENFLKILIFNKLYIFVLFHDGLCLFSILYNIFVNYISYFFYNLIFLI